jgi:hypothetical protein
VTDLAAAYLRALDDYVAGRREERDAAMGDRCPDCDGMDGMASIMRETLTDEEIIAAYQWYTYPGGCDHYLYITCWQCNPRGRIPAGYEPVDAAWVRAWLARTCGCQDCRQERHDNAAPADSDGRRGAERMYR